MNIREITLFCRVNFLCSRAWTRRSPARYDLVILIHSFPIFAQTCSPIFYFSIGTRNYRQNTHFGCCSPAAFQRPSIASAYSIYLHAHLVWGVSGCVVVSALHLGSACMLVFVQVVSAAWKFCKYRQSKIVCHQREVLCWCVRTYCKCLNVLAHVQHFCFLHF